MAQPLSARRGPWWLGALTRECVVLPPADLPHPAADFSGFGALDAFDARVRPEADHVVCFVRVRLGIAGFVGLVHVSVIKPRATAAGAVLRVAVGCARRDTELS